jgi:hypothetical protein
MIGLEKGPSGAAGRSIGQEKVPPGAPARHASAVIDLKGEGGSDVSEVIFIVEEAPEGGYTARALGASIFTEADDLRQLHAQVRDAVQCHFVEEERPKVIRLHFVREELIAV